MKRLGPAEPPAPQFYRVACPAGHVLRGPRTEGYQALRCPGCGEGLFVLPRSPLPEPPAPADRPRRRGPAPGEQEDEPIRWIEPPAVAVEETSADPQGIDFYEETIAAELEAEAAGALKPEPTAPVARTEEPVRPRDPSSRPRPQRPKRTPEPAEGAAPGGPPPGVTRPAPRKRVPLAGPQITVRARPSLRVRIWRHRHLLALGLVALLVSATVGYRWYRSRWEALPRIAEAARVEGLEALSTGAFDVAKQRLDAAATALETLRDPTAAGVRQSALEAAIFADFARPLEEIFEEVATSSDPAGAQLVHKGRSFWIDSDFEDPPRQGTGLRLVDRLFTGAGDKFGVIDLDGLKLFEGKAPRPGEPVTFGARIQAIEVGPDNLWHVRLEPDSGVFLTSPEGWKGWEAKRWSRTREVEGLP